MRPMNRAASGIAVVACGLALMAADFGTSAHPPQGDGAVRGVVLRLPGRDPRSGSGGGPDAMVPVNGDVVRAADHQGHEVAKSTTGRGGRFELTLPPGVYRITEDICGVGRQTEVRSTEIASVTLVIPAAC